MFGHDDDDDDDELPSPSEDLVGHGVGYIPLGTLCWLTDCPTPRRESGLEHTCSMCLRMGGEDGAGQG